MQERYMFVLLNPAADPEARASGNSPFVVGPIAVALACPLPPANATVATETADPESFGAMAVLAMRAACATETADPLSAGPRAGLAGRPAVVPIDEDIRERASTLAGVATRWGPGM